MVQVVMKNIHNTPVLSCRGNDHSSVYLHLLLEKHTSVTRVHL